MSITGPTPVVGHPIRKSLSLTDDNKKLEFVFQYQGYALYRHVFKEEYPTPSNLTITGIRDRGYVMIDQVNNTF